MRIAAELTLGVAQLEPIRLLRDALAAQQPDHDLERFVHPPARVLDVDAHHVGIGGQLAWTDAEHHAAPRQVVEHRDPVGDHQRVVIGQRDDPRPQSDPARPLGCRRDEDLGRGDAPPLVG